MQKQRQKGTERGKQRQSETEETERHRGIQRRQSDRK